jgi:hypothetical protein
MVKAKPLPPLELLRDLFEYESDTGLLHYRRTTRNGLRRAGDTAGHPKDNGYLQVMVQKRGLLVHRVAWCLYTGQQPPEVIDHINGKVQDNRWGNLRAATARQNQGNRRQVGQYLPGTWRKCNRWQAGTPGNYLGMFATEEEAHQAYVQWHLQRFGEFSIYADRAS